MKFKHLPEEMQHAIRALQELYGTPEEFAITFMLGIVNSAVAPYYNVNSSKYGVRPTALYLMALADTGIGKGTIERELTQWGQRTWLEQEKAKNLEARKAEGVEGATARTAKVLLFGEHLTHHHVVWGAGLQRSGEA